ncbi:MAG: hypothetical protein WBP85_03470 [Terracidiphilus sp.]
MRDDFTEDVKRVIANRANLICSNPDCGSPTGGPQEDPSKALNIGVAAHITAASPGGPRYRDVLTAEQRSSAWNGIWLCQNCAKLVDNDASMFPEDFLRAWKTIREHNALHSIGKTKTASLETESQRKCKELCKWVGKRVMWVQMNTGRKAEVMGARTLGGVYVLVLECTEFFVKVKGDGWDRTKSFPLDNIKFGYDDKVDCLEILDYAP